MKKRNGSGISFLGLLGVLFIGLKLAEVITWSWWLVLAPLWIPIGIPLGIVFGGLIVVLVSFAADKIREQMEE